MSKVPVDKSINHLVGPIKTFEPHAIFSIERVEVITKDCSYYRGRVINGWIEVFLENHRPWYAPWKRCVGFSVFYPSRLRVPGKILVEDVLNQVAGIAIAGRFGKHKAQIYRLAKGLTVLIPDQEG